jgi:hypothetical protein
MAKESEKRDFDDLLLPDASLEFGGTLPAAGDADSGEMLAPQISEPPAETAAVTKRQQDEQYAKELRAEDLYSAQLRSEDPRADRSEAERGKTRQRSMAGFLETLSKANLYTVLLGAALLAVAIAVLCLLGELGRYRFDIKANEGKATMQKMS